MNKIDAIVSDLMRSKRITQQEGLAIGAAVRHVANMNPAHRVFADFCRSYSGHAIDGAKDLLVDQFPTTFEAIKIHPSDGWRKCRCCKSWLTESQVNLDGYCGRCAPIKPTTIIHCAECGKNTPLTNSGLCPRCS